MVIRGIAQDVDEALWVRLMRELADEARTQRFEVAPNPCVGAAVLAGERVVGRGVHEYYGGPHAEVLALQAAERSGVPRAEWNTLVVTLEPCCTSGKTGPCTDVLLEAAIPRVVVGELDPDPRHRGRGLERLAQAGVEIVQLPGFAPLSEVSPHFLAWLSPDRLRRPRPWVIAKWAQTRTGQLSPPQDVGEGRWISGPASRAEVQVLRSRVDAVLTGVGTVIADNPRLSVRAPGERTCPPSRIVLDGYLRTSPEAALFDRPEPGEAAGPVAILPLPGADPARRRALEEAGALVVGIRADDQGRVSLRGALTWLWEEGARRVLLEAGPELLSEALRLDLVDQLRVYTGPVNGGRGPSMGPWLAEHAPHLKGRLDRECGEDAVLEAFLGT